MRSYLMAAMLLTQASAVIAGEDPRRTIFPRGFVYDSSDLSNHVYSNNQKNNSLTHTSQMCSGDRPASLATEKGFAELMQRLPGLIPNMTM